MLQDCNREARSHNNNLVDSKHRFKGILPARDSNISTMIALIKINLDNWTLNLAKIIRKIQYK